MQPVDCATCWKTGPKFTIYFSVLIIASMVIIAIVELIAFGTMGYISYYYMGLVPYMTLNQLELWRIFTCHFCVGSLWSALFYGLVFFSPSFMLEREIGTKKYLLIIVCATLVSTLLALFIAFVFSYTPGINEWDYLYNFWWDGAATGPGMLCIIVNIMDWKVRGSEPVRFCFCFDTKIWVVDLISIILCQVAMVPPYKGIWYNLAAVIVGLCIPKKWLRYSINKMVGVYLINDGRGTIENGEKVEKDKGLKMFTGKGKTI